LAANYSYQTFIGLMPVDQGIQLVRDATSKALSLESKRAPTLLRQAWIAMYYDRDFAAAARHLEGALELEPANADVLAESGLLARILGRLDQAIAIGEYQVSLDPINAYGQEILAYTFLYAGRWDDALVALRTVLSLSPNYLDAHEGIGEVLLQKGDTQAALAEMQQEVPGHLRLVGLSLAYHASGQKTQSDAALEQLIRNYADTAPVHIAYVFAYRGETESAFEWLSKAAAARNVYLYAVTGHPMFDKIRSDSRWLPFLRKHGMAPEQLAAIKFEVKLPQ
jgi:tetratricopeptide (TPR) repeat protein